MEKTVPTISVIVPVYNVAAYLPKCLESIINQTYKNLEIIVVNDGSSDESPQICEEYAKRDIRIKLLHKENGGLSSARNAGLDIASGEYIGFVDSDDFIEKNMYEEMLNTLEEYSADFVICNCFSGIKREYPCKKSMLANVDTVFKLYLNDKVQAFAWNKLYSKKIFDNLRYEKGILFEDMAVFLPILEKTQKIVLLNTLLYHYVERDDSITNSGFSVKLLKCLDIIESYKEYSKKCGGIYDDLIEKRLVLMNWWLFCKMHGAKKEYESYIDRFVKCIKECKPNFPVTSKADFLLLRMLAYGFNAGLILRLRNWYLRIETCIRS